MDFHDNAMNIHEAAFEIVKELRKLYKTKEERLEYIDQRKEEGACLVMVAVVNGQTQWFDLEPYIHRRLLDDTIGMKPLFPRVDPFSADSIT
jgi:hypothetical protein